MPNLNYEIKEKRRPCKPVNVHSLMAEVSSFDVNEDREYHQGCNEFDLAYAYRVDYNTNYNVRQLSMILDYYNISKRKLK